MLTLLERLRIDARLTRPKLAEASGVPIRTIRELETGNVRSPRLETLVPLADALTAAGQEVAPSVLAQDFATTFARQAA